MNPFEPPDSDNEVGSNEYVPRRSFTIDLTYRMLVVNAVSGAWLFRAVTVYFAYPFLNVAFNVVLLGVLYNFFRRCSWIDYLAIVVTVASTLGLAVVPWLHIFGVWTPPDIYVEVCGRLCEWIWGR